MARFLNLLTGVVALAAIAGASPAGAAVVFFDNFDADPTGLNATPAGWTVTTGTVDIVNVSSDGINCVTGNCIDTDGSSFQAGTMSTNATFGPDNFVLSFYLSGNQRTPSDDTVNVFFSGTLVDSITVAWLDPFALHSYNVSGSGRVTFAAEGGDNFGAVLDNVQLATAAAAVPEPGTLATLGGGLATFGLMRRRRRAS